MPASLVGKDAWIVNPWIDALFFILAPLWILPTFGLLQSAVGAVALSNFILAYGSLGHHLPGLIRVYTEPTLFQRYKTRFLLAPVFFLGVCGIFAYHDLNGLGIIVLLWGTWHGAMQVNGFLRIYDSKAHSIASITGRLDWWMCLMWFGAAILHSTPKLSSLLGHFYGSGGALIPAQGFMLFRWLWDIGTVVVTLLFLLNLAAQWKKGQSASMLKLASMASSFGFWWYCMVGIENLLVGLALWEIFHDFQYNALVWAFNKKRVANRQPTSAVERYLFQPQWSRLAIYAALVLGYGHLGSLASYANVHLPSELLNENNLSVWLTRLLMASAFLHFYFDGFIWKIRDNHTQQGLDIRSDSGTGGASSGSESPSRQRWGGIPVLAFGKWALFIVPTAYLGYAQSHHWGGDALSQHTNMSELLEDSWYAHFMAGSLFKSTGDHEKSLPYFQKSVELKPGFAPGYLLLADVYYRIGKKKEASENYSLALALEPENGEGQLNLANLYLELQKPQDAIRHFQASLGINPGNPEAFFGLASAQLKSGDLAGAEINLKEAVQRRPGFASAWNYLGMLAEVRLDTLQALRYYQTAVHADPGLHPVQERLRALGGFPAP